MASLRDITADSLIFKAFDSLGFLIKNSALVKWYTGSDNYTNLVVFRHSVTYGILTFITKPIGSIILHLGRWLHKLIEPSATRNTLVNIKSDWQSRPMQLLAMAGISLVVVNTVGRMALGQTPGWRGLTIRIGLVLIGLLLYKTRVSWSKITGHSLVVKYLSKLVVEP